MKNKYIKTNNTYWVKIYISGDINASKQIIQKYALNNGICVTINPTIFVYTGGRENGVVVQLINYPRFPESDTVIWKKAEKIAKLLLDGTYQYSALIMDSEKTTWITKRNHENN